MMYDTVLMVKYEMLTIQGLQLLIKALNLLTTTHSEVKVDFQTGT